MGEPLRSALAVVFALVVQGGVVAAWVGPVEVGPGSAIVPNPAQASWMGGVGSALSLVGKEPGRVAFREERSVPELVDAVYGHLGVGLSAADAARVAAEVRSLDPRVGFALQQLLGAVEVGMAEWAAATGVLSVEDWGVLASGERGTRADEVLGKVDAGFMDASLSRVLGVVEAVQPLLAAGAGAVGSDAVLFPGPNEGLLFNDPFNLILVGGVGRSVYRGNTYPSEVILDRTENILTIDVGGDDVYYDHAASAHPLPKIACNYLLECNGGVPISLTLDISGDDLYQPINGRWESVISGDGLGYGYGFGLGALIEASGNERYDVQLGLGRGSHRGYGILVDVDGEDVYSSGPATQAAGDGQGSLGVLFDAKGSDTYGANPARGYTAFDGNAIFVDGCGQDHYDNWPGADGEIWQWSSTGHGVDVGVAC